MPKSAARKLLDFQKLQYQFSAHIRDPEKNLAPDGVEDRRMKIYRDLFYNNVEDCLAGAFPVLRRLSPDDVWHRRIRDFYSRHQCHEPQFHKVAEEFLSFLNQARGENPDDPPFLHDLCHYEWVELELSVSALQLSPELADPNGDLLIGRPLVSPLAWALAYEWPVHKISPDFQPTEPGPQPTYLIVNRNRHDEVKFMEINPVAARLMELLEADHNASGRSLLAQIAGELQHPEPESVIQGGAEILNNLRARDIILGTRR